MIRQLYSSVMKGCLNEYQLPHILQSVTLPKQLSEVLQASHVVVAEKPYCKKQEMLHALEGRP